jgi:hypothetical protein
LCHGPLVIIIIIIPSSQSINAIAHKPLVTL